MPNDLLSRMHSSVSVNSGDWANFRTEITGSYGVSGSNEYYSQHIIREYNKNVFELEPAFKKEAPPTTGLLLRPFDGGFSYLGTGDFIAYP